MGTRHKILTPQQAAAKARISVAELLTLTATDDGPAYIAMGPRLIRYLKTDIAAWITGRDDTNPS